MSFNEGFRAGKSFTEALFSGIARFFQTVFHGGARSRGYSKNSEIRELQRLYDAVTASFKESPFCELDAYEHACRIAISACERAGHKPTVALLDPFVDIAFWLYGNDGFGGAPDIDWQFGLATHYDILQLRKKLQRLGKLFNGGEDTLTRWSATLGAAFEAILAAIPKRIDLEAKQGPFTIELVNIIEEPARCLDAVLSQLLCDETLTSGFFDGEAERTFSHVLEVSGIEEREFPDTSKPLIHPLESGLKGRELVERYLGNTAFEYLFTYPHAFEIPRESRLEHCHILAGTGHGKTQLMQALILDDLAHHTERGVCVIDSQGDLIKKLSMHHRFDVEAPDSLADKFILIDPTDVEYPACCNLFALNRTDVAGSSPLNREMIVNSTVELYTYMFGALFGAELTQRQGLIFQYLARLMMQIPDATIQTLRELLEDGKKFTPYMEKLGGSAQAFFKTQFFSTQFTQTKRQVLARLWSILSNSTLERIFSHVDQKIDLYAAINSGKIVLINTAKDLLGREGSQILGRFFIALLAQAIIKRAALSGAERRPFYVYIDEAHEYFDENIEQLLNQARKYRVGLTLSHQNLDQLGKSLRAAIMSSASIKLAGGLSSADAAAIAQETRAKREDLLAVRKRDDHSEFACWIKNVTDEPVTLRVPFGLLEKEPILSETAYTRLIESNRRQYCVPAATLSFTVPASTKTEPIRKPTIVPTEQSKQKQAPIPAKPQKGPDVNEVASDVVDEVEVKQVVIAEPAPSPPTSGKGGPQHRYLQNLIKKIAQERGYKATIEEAVLDGEGSVDVALEGHGEKIACEITVTTGYEWEFQNLMKCLAAGYDRVIAVSSDSKKLKGLNGLASERLRTELENGKLLFLEPTALIAYLDQKRADTVSEQKTVRGYTVKVKYSALSKEAEKARTTAIARVILRSSKIE